MATASIRGGHGFVFQPTRPQGARLTDMAAFWSITVSTHAPAGGATLDGTESIRHSEFQPTRPQGARRLSYIKPCSLACFNPRARRGRDLLFSYRCNLAYRFNPRARRGRDISHLLIALKVISFNPRARRGRDTVDQFPRSAADRFNPRARRGRDSYDKPFCANSRGVSTHAPAGGATRPLAPPLA